MVLTYRSSQGIVIFDKVRHARSPIMQLICLGVLGPSAVAEPPLGFHSCHHVHFAQINLNPFIVA